MGCRNNSENEDVCHYKEYIDPNETPLTSAFMFAAGIFGNVAALVILVIRRRRYSRFENTRRGALFHIFILTLVITDLMGTCLITPLVQLSYARNMTLIGMVNCAPSLCQYFGASMNFFSLATMSLLFVTAVERCLALGYPYLYSRHVTKKCAYIVIPLLFLFCLVFCLLPFASFGKYVQYCPGTWCFIDMNPKNPEDGVYANLYATVMLVLVLAIVACNGFVVYQLFRMYQRRKRNGSVVSTKRHNSERRKMSVPEEVEHLILLVFMTIIFIICTLPLVIRVYMNSITHRESHAQDLEALRFISMNSIVDPWVFILFSPSVLHFFWFSVCQAPLGTTRGSVCKTIAMENSTVNTVLCHQTLYKEQFPSENV
ncbi:prostaglandin E receptor 2a (subtype EP2) [Xenentodon cancila]